MNTKSRGCWRVELALCSHGEAEFPRNKAMAAACGARGGGSVPLPFVTSYRAALPASARLLGICRGGFWPVWPVGRRLDDSGAHAALPALGNLGTGFCTPGGPPRCAVVAALALWNLARDQCRAARSRRSLTAAPGQRRQRGGKPNRGELGDARPALALVGRKLDTVLARPRSRRPASAPARAGYHNACWHCCCSRALPAAPA